MEQNKPARIRSAQDSLSSSYEDRFEQGLEDGTSFSGSYHDDQLEDLFVHEEGYCSSDYSQDEVILDDLHYLDCDAELERILTNGNVTLSPEEIEQLIANKPPHQEPTARLKFLRLFRKLTKNSFYDAPEEVGYDTTPDSGVHENLQNMDPEQRAKLEEEWRNELAKTEEEIQTLRQVLASHLKRSQDLKRKLGISVWKEFRDDMEQGLKNVRESNAYKSVNGKFNEVHHAVTTAPLYQKTNLALKSASEKTTTVLGSLGANVSKKLGDVKNSTAFRSFEEKVGSAYTNVRTKVGGSRSSSMQNFEEVLEGADGVKSTGPTPATTPAIPEEKPLS